MMTKAFTKRDTWDTLLRLSGIGAGGNPGGDDASPSRSAARSSPAKGAATSPRSVQGSASNSVPGATPKSGKGTSHQQTRNSSPSSAAKGGKSSSMSDRTSSHVACACLCVSAIGEPAAPLAQSSAAASQRSKMPAPPSASEIAAWQPAPGAPPPGQPPAPRSPKLILTHMPRARGWGPG